MSKTLVITNLILSKELLKQAIMDECRGCRSQTIGPLIVTIHISGVFLLSGYHRLVEAILKEQKTVSICNRDCGDFLGFDESDVFVCTNTRFAGLESLYPLSVLEELCY